MVLTNNPEALNEEKTREFFSRFGTRIFNLKDIQEKGDLLAVVEPKHGFYAFVTNGYEVIEKHEDRRTGKIHVTFDKDLNEASWKDSVLLGVKCEIPDKYFLAVVIGEDSLTNQYGDFELENPRWKEIPTPDSVVPGARFDFGPKHVEQGIYRVTSISLRKKLKECLNNS